VARRVIAIDQDATANARLADRLATMGLRDKFDLKLGDFLQAQDRGDVVLFEFCLHEITDPARPRQGPLTGSRDRRHRPCPRSPWSFMAAEEDKVIASWAAVDGQSPRLTRCFEAVQVFAEHADLVAKVETQGEQAIRRCRLYQGKKDIAFLAPYRIAVLS